MPRRVAADVQFVANKHGTGEIVHHRARHRGKTVRHVYSAALYLAVPFFFARLLWRGLRNPAYWRRLGERFGLGGPIESDRGSVWIHAVSVGEVQAALPIVKMLLSHYPSETFVVTTTTPTGADHLSKALGDAVEHRYLPFDLPGAMARFLDRIGPRVAVVMETEIWPNLLALCRVRRVPVVLANVRLSERSAEGYRRFPRLFAAALDGVAGIAVQSRDDGRRMESIGAPSDVIEVTGSTKFDVPVLASLREEAEALRRTWGAARGIWIAASTHAGEEDLALDAFEHVLEWLPSSLLVLVPRHPERFGEAAALARRRGFSPMLRSARPADCSGAQVFIGDTMGELPLLYAAADVAFVGGTLVEVGGHNMLEPAALGLPVLFGPHVFNFADISQGLVEAGGAEVVVDSERLGRAVVGYLTDANLRHVTGRRGRAFVEANRGARDRVIAMIRTQAQLPDVR